MKRSYFSLFMAGHESPGKGEPRDSTGSLPVKTFSSVERREYFNDMMMRFEYLTSQ